MVYFARGAFAEDPWIGREMIDGPDWDSADGTAGAGRIALQLQPGFAVESLAGHLAAVGLVKIVFPKFTDGRGYSMGWLLRGRLGFEGEMRAVGDVLFDEMQLMARCGFDSYEITDAATIDLLRDGRRAGVFDRFYQPGLEPEVPAGTRPWARRPAPGPAGNLG